MDFLRCRGGRCLIFFGLAVLMRWLLIGLLISVVVLLCVAGAVTRHILRQRRVQPGELPAEDVQPGKDSGADAGSEPPPPAD